MGFLDRLLGRKGGQPAAAEAPEPVCPHSALVPFWDSADDMGKRDKVARYECESCQQRFTREEGERLLAEEAERVRLSDEERHREQ